MEIPNPRILNNIEKSQKSQDLNEKSQKSQLKYWIPEIPKMAFMTLIHITNGHEDCNIEYPGQFPNQPFTVMHDGQIMRYG